MFSSIPLFFDIGGGEIMLILMVVLLLFGGEKLPQLARGLGKGIRDFKDASEGVKREITNQIDNFEAKKIPAPAETNNTVETVAPVTVAAAETPAPVAAPVISNTVPVNSMPIAEIGSTDAIEPVKTEPVHLRETPIEPANTAHEEYKS